MLGAVPDAPVFTAVPADQSIDEDAAFGPLAIEATDADGDALTLTATSSNPDLLPDASLTITPTGDGAWTISGERIPPS